MTGEEAVRRLKKMGWRVDRIQGSHHVLKKGNQTEVIAVHSGRDIPRGEFEAIRKRTGL